MISMRARSLLALALALVGAPALADPPGRPASVDAGEPSSPVAVATTDGGVVEARPLPAVDPATHAPVAPAAPLAVLPEVAAPLPPASGPYYRRSYFWLAVTAGALTVGALIYGVSVAASYTPRYALVVF